MKKMINRKTEEIEALLDETLDLLCPVDEEEKEQEKRLIEEVEKSLGFVF